MLSLLQMSLAGSLIILATVLLRTLIKYHLAKTTLLLLWSVAMLRLLLPFSISTPLSFYNSLNKLQPHVISFETLPEFSVRLPFIQKAPVVENTKEVNLNDPKNQVAASAEHVLDHDFNATADLSEQKNFLSVDLSGFTGHPIVWQFIWLSGFLILAARIILTHLQRRRDYLAALPLSKYETRFMLRGCKGANIRLAHSDKITSPMAYGLIRPVILLPRSFDPQNENQLDYIIAHELVHIRRKDILFKALLAFVLCLHWFNPLVWLMFYLVSRDIELSCDEIVVRKFGLQSRSDYALTLIGMMESKTRLVSCTNAFCQNSVAERIKAVMKSKNLTWKRGLISLILVTVIFLTLATSAVAGESISMNLPDNDLFQKSLGKIGITYADSLNSPDNSEAVQAMANTTWSIEKILFTDLDVYALLAAEVNSTKPPEIKGEITLPGSGSETGSLLYGLDGNIRELESDAGGKNYYLYSATLTQAEKPVPGSPQEKALILAAGDQWRYYTSLKQHEGSILQLVLGADQKVTLSAPVSRVRSQHITLELDSRRHGNNFYSTAVINPFMIQLSGSSNLSKEIIEENFYWFQPDIEMYVEMDDGLRIFAGIWGENRGTKSDLETPGYSLGGGSASGDPASGEFHLTQHFRFFQLDMTSAAALIINGIRYPLN